MALHRPFLTESMSMKSPLATEPEVQPEAPWIRRFPLRSPTLPPATHTNAYLLGETELTIVDPGTPDVEELMRLVAEVERLRGLGHTLRGIFLTHHHFDHVSGTPFLQEKLGVPVFAHPLTAARVEILSSSLAAAVAISTRQVIQPLACSVSRPERQGHTCA